jgi:hypothetical protein
MKGFGDDTLLILRHVPRTPHALLTMLALAWAYPNSLVIERRTFASLSFARIVWVARRGRSDAAKPIAYARFTSWRRTATPAVVWQSAAAENSRIPVIDGHT